MGVRLAMEISQIN